ncbi:MAG TPA: hypothetical protein VFU36_10590 [Jatrophihabitans sp.]|nr:hypothetical protein [Jatrophihabitans sp.]
MPPPLQISADAALCPEADALAGPVTATPEQPSSTAGASAIVAMSLRKLRINASVSRNRQLLPTAGRYGRPGADIKIESRIRRAEQL